MQSNCNLSLQCSQRVLQLDFEPEDLKSCASKVCCVFQLNQCVEMADKILKVQDKLQLRGDFDEVEEIKFKVEHCVYNHESPYNGCVCMKSAVQTWVKTYTFIGYLIVTARCGNQIFTLCGLQPF